ncbi:hypothetical protein ACJRO7_007301 [Eucalyptus globulus]|uniref:Uncharacterized protein n=1 Tax=Eucalyptus globulus TaxID=34317 RepID=A0ABD3IM80_EUCGL
MDRLIGLEPSNVVAVRIEAGQMCSGHLTLRTVMYTMPVAFRLQPLNKPRYTVRPQSGIIPPLQTLTVDVTYHLPPGSTPRPGRATGAAVNGLDQHGWTALHRAAFKGQADAGRTLLDKGVDVDARDEDGYAALHCTAESGQFDVVELLVKKGADVEARTNRGVTALQVADSLQYARIMRILVHGGALKDGGRQGGGVACNGGLKMKTAMKKKQARERPMRSSFDGRPWRRWPCWEPEPPRAARVHRL